MQTLKSNAIAIARLAPGEIDGMKALHAAFMKRWLSFSR